MALTRINNQALPTLDADKLPSGSIIQVKTYTGTAQKQKDNSAYLDVISGSITPTSTSSKILMTFTGRMYIQAHSTELLSRFLRDSTELETYNSVFNGPSGDRMASAGSNEYVDSPSSTSSITYKYQIKSGSASYNAFINPNGVSDGTYVLKLMEIAG